MARVKDMSDRTDLDESLSGTAFGVSLVESMHGVENPLDQPSADDLTVHPIPPLPPIGESEKYYADGIKRAERDDDRYARVAYKVGQYVTLSLDPKADWPAKQKYYSHCMRRHCTPPAYAQGDLRKFFHDLSDIVRTHAGQEAIKICCEQDDLFAARLGMGQTNDDLVDDAEAFFDQIVPTKKPAWFNDDDWRQLCMIRDQWV
ncbi:MAG: hypothetical protein AAF743_03735 [Planctomycetota bacterium]